MNQDLLENIQELKEIIQINRDNNIDVYANNIILKLIYDVKHKIVVNEYNKRIQDCGDYKDMVECLFTGFVFERVLKKE